MGTLRTINRSGYDSLKNEIDSVCRDLHLIHTDNMVCRAGCDSCCMDFGLMAVELYAILDDLKDLRPAINPDRGRDKCPFLSDHLCTIYDYRPVICRTHGLPMLQTGDDGWELSSCNLNFSGCSETYFHEQNCYRQDLYNSKLFLLNREFLSYHPGLDIGEKEVTSLSELACYLEEPG